MGIPRWLLAISSLVAAAAMLQQCTSKPETPATEATFFKPVATLEQLMEATVEPASYVIFDAAVWINGELVGAPKNDEEWEAVEHAALTLAESGNLMMMAPRAMDQGAWMQMSRALVETAMVAHQAAESKSVDAVLRAGGLVYDTCVNCHATYLLKAQALRGAVGSRQ